MQKIDHVVRFFVAKVVFGETKSYICDMATIPSAGYKNNVRWS